MPAHSRALRRLALCLLLVAALVPVARAQNPRGTLRGTVEDSSGARVPSAAIVVQSQASGLQRTAMADDRGEFRVDDLPPGAYRVLASKPGFAPAASDATVVVSEVRDLAVVLQPAGISQQVTVAAQSSSITTQAIDLASAVHQGAISSQDLETLPLAHRSFANIAYLVPGTEPVEPSDPTKARITAVSFGGSSGLNVELSVDGGDNSDDYIGGFLQNYSPDAIQEFVVRTAQEDADTGRTTGGSVVIDTKRGTNEWHGDAAFYERAAALNARLPIDNPPPEPKQPFSRQNYIGTVGGPIRRDKIWFFSSLEYVHEDASIAYSPASLSQFQSLAQLATEGLIPGVSSIAVPNNAPVPFDDYLATTRFDWAQSQRSQWFLRAAVDRYTTDNDLVQQATLPSTGATSRANYMNLLLNQHFSFSPTWLGSLTLEASALHHTETRNTDLGFALAFPFSSTASTISGFETFGDNQFVTPITAFPVLRNQQKYQFRYDVSHSTGHHAPRFGVNLIHEPVLSGALSGNAETLIQFPNNPDFYVANPSQFYSDLTCATPQPAGVNCTATPAANGSFVAERPAPRPLRRRFLACHAPPHRQLRLALRHHLRPLHRFRPLPTGQSRFSNARRPRHLDHSLCQWRAARLPQSFRSASRHRLRPRTKFQNRFPRRVWPLLQRSRPERLGRSPASRQYLARTLHRSAKSSRPHQQRLRHFGFGHRFSLPHSLRHPRHRRLRARLQR